MSSYSIVDLLTFVELASCILALVVMQYRRQISQFKPLALFLLVRVSSVAISLPLMSMAGKQINKHLAYQIYFYVYWCSYALEAILGFCIIYVVYNLAMAPLKGLQRLGMLMFRWAAGIAVAIATTMAFGPHVTSAKFIMRAVTQLQQTQSVLTLCMLLFVCLAIRPMGLSYRSKIFGVSLGLGVAAATGPRGCSLVCQLQVDVLSQQHRQWQRHLPDPLHLGRILRHPGTAPSHDHPADHVALPPLEPDIARARRRTRLCRTRRHHPGYVRSSRGRSDAQGFREDELSSRKLALISAKSKRPPNRVASFLASIKLDYSPRPLNVHFRTGPTSTCTNCDTG